MISAANLPDLAALCRLSAVLGRDPTRTQGAGGNTSLKAGNVMWIKASGTWLAEAETRGIMVPVDLPALLAAVAADDPAAEKPEAFLVSTIDSTGLRPSIETSVHALMPQRVVLHIHCVETIAWAVLDDGADAIAEHLAGIAHAFVPYARPGLPLAKAIVQALGGGTADVLVLGNHGLVVAGTTVEEAEARLEEVVARLKRPVRPAPPENVEALQSFAGPGWRLPRHAESHGIATDPESLAVARRGSLYPDHVIFLGPSIAVLEPGESLADLSRRLEAAGRPSPVMAAVPGAGVLMRADASASADEMARCLALVASRLSPDEPIRTLTASDEHDLVHWDAEKYRKELEKKRAAGG